MCSSFSVYREKHYESYSRIRESIDRPQTYYRNFYGDSETEEEVTKALEQLKLLSSAYKEKYNKIHFLQSLMTDSIPTYNVYDRAARLHIAPEEPRILYLLETSHSLDEDISEILKNLFPSQSGAFRIPLTEASCQISGRFFTGNCTSYCPHDRGYRKRGSSGTCPCFVQQDSA